MSKEVAGAAKVPGQTGGGMRQTRPRSVELLDEKLVPSAEKTRSRRFLRRMQIGEDPHFATGGSYEVEIN